MTFAQADAAQEDDVGLVFEEGRAQDVLHLAPKEKSFLPRLPAAKLRRMMRPVMNTLPSVTRKAQAAETHPTWPRIARLALALAIAGWTLRGVGAESSPLPPPDADGFVSLFNGRDLSEWDGDTKLWSVKDGAIVGESTTENPTKGTYLFRRGVTLSDFELRLKFRLPSGNSGVQYRSVQLPDWQVAGYQADMDAANAYTGIIYEVGGRAIMVGRGEKAEYDAAGRKKVLGTLGTDKDLLAVLKRADWNEYTIIAEGSHLIQKINGKLMVDVVDNAEGKRRDRGVIGFQLHPGPPMRVEFKEIRVKLLKPAAKAN